MMQMHALLRLAARPACLRPYVASRQTVFARPQRNLHVLGIESSADDTCVALMNMKKLLTGEDAAYSVINHKVSCPNSKHKGIHPVEAAASHREHLPRLIAMSLSNSIKPDLICVTRGPGMNGCLSVGVSAAQELAHDLKVPIVGVHHMQAHALTPLMENALRSWNEGENREPLINQRSILTLLVSGKHTMLVHTKSELNHRILIPTQSIALGDVLDKIARLLVPSELLPSENTAVCYPEMMQSLVNSRFSQYDAPSTRAEELKVHQSEYGWRLFPPLRETREMKYDFTSLNSRALTILRERPDMPMAERQDLAYHTLRIAFEHLISRVLIALQTDEELLRDPPKTLVIAGGVASNGFLSVIARRMLQKRGYPDIRCVVPKKRWCTDNAAMVAFAGYKMWEAGWRTDGSFLPAPRWSLEEILTGVRGWVRRPGFPPIAPEDAQSSQDVQSVDDEHAEGVVSDSEDKPAISLGETATQIPLKSVDGIDSAIAQLLRDTSLYVQEHETSSYGKSEIEDVSASAIGDAHEYKVPLSRQIESSTMTSSSHLAAVEGSQVQQSPEESDAVDALDRASTPSKAQFTLSTVDSMPWQERKSFLAYLDNPNTRKIPQYHRERFGMLLSVEDKSSQGKVEVAPSTTNAGYEPTSIARHQKMLLREDYASQDKYAGERSTEKALRPEPAAEEPKRRMDNLPLDHKVWSVLSTATEKPTRRVRFVGSEENPATAKSASLKGRIATVFEGWLGRK